MITQVVVVAPDGAAWPDFAIPMLEPGPNGLFIFKIDGLTPVQAAVNTHGYGNVDGEFYTGSKVPKRNLVFHIGLESRAHDVEAARRLLYGYFMTKRPIKLRFDFDDREPVAIEGYYETIEGDRFAQDLETTISVICPKPNFVAVEEQVVMGATGDIEVAHNGGDQSIGVRVRVDSPNHYTGPVRIEALLPGSGGTYFSDREFVLDSPEIMFFDFEYIWVNSKQGEKVIEARLVDQTILSDNKRTLLPTRQEGSIWPVLHPGDNHFRVSTPGDATARTWEIRYFDEFGAI